MFGEKARLLAKVEELPIPANLAGMQNRQLFEFRDRLRFARAAIEDFAARRRGTFLARVAARVGAICTLLGGLDLVWQWLGGQRGILSVQADAAVTLVGFVALTLGHLHVRSTVYGLRKVLAALQRVVAEIDRVEDEIQARLLGHRWPENPAAWQR